ELALVNEKAKSQRKHILMLAASGFAILILIILILVWRAYQNSVRQQRIAAKRIDELIAQQPLEADSTPENQEDYQQFTDMQNKIICEGLFKSPNLNRDGIAEASGLSRAKVSQLIGKFTGLSPNEYINKLRVEYSLKMIKEHPEWTIDAIAESCGYIRRATYYSHFKKLFDISPAQYRKEKSKTEPKDEETE
ncbi:MAG: helix-turn-helix transcriptional regulator, partial [Muribaculaceae bacterium]|nr:helix-turn-helix transcriptional regulator [Muribaculaceae bacterium]